MKLRAVIRDALARVTRIQDALDDGDRALAGQLLRDLARDLERVLEPGIRCPRCERSFRWPGEVEEHVRTMHIRDAA